LTAIRRARPAGEKPKDPLVVLGEAAFIESASIPCFPKATMLTPIPLSRPWIDDVETARVTRALSGKLSGDGPIDRAVERRLETLLGADRVLLTTSCTHALELALLTLGIGPGHEVICPSFTFASCANAILRVGARPAFADIEPRSLGLDPTDVARRITSRTRAIMPVHYAGTAACMDELSSLARKFELRIVEDAAHGLGGAFRGRALGTLGDAGCFSFHETKNITCGEGGALAFGNRDLAKKAEIIREKGTNRSAFFRGEVDKYSWVAEGSSYVLSEVLGAILDGQLDKFEEIQRRRASVCERYAAGLGSWADDQGVDLPRVFPERQSAHHIFFLLYPHEAGRNRALADLKAAGIGASFHYVPLHSAPQAKAIDPMPSALPVTDSISGRLLRLPLHPLLTDAEIERVISRVRLGRPRE
jgi:dTDP-4-amino-4,6-dideoxygalactose transaminase